MAEYKRFISYLYEYEGGEQLSNVGYAKVEARNDQCKLFLHFAVPGWNEKTLKIYIFSRNSPRYQFAYLGELQVQSGVGEFKLKTNRENLMDSKISFDLCGGIVAYDSERRFSACTWDDQEIPENLVRSISHPSEVLDLAAEKPVIQVVDRKELQKVDPAEEKNNTVSQTESNETKAQIGTEAEVQQSKQEPENPIRESNQQRQEIHSQPVHNSNRQGFHGRNSNMQNTQNTQNMNHVQNRNGQTVRQNSENPGMRGPARQTYVSMQNQEAAKEKNVSGNQSAGSEHHNSSPWL